MNNNTKARLRRLRKEDPNFFQCKARVRPGHSGKVSCLTYGKRLNERHPVEVRP